MEIYKTRCRECGGDELTVYGSCWFSNAPLHADGFDKVTFSGGHPHSRWLRRRTCPSRTRPRWRRSRPRRSARGCARASCAPTTPDVNCASSATNSTPCLLPQPSGQRRRRSKPRPRTGTGGSDGSADERKLEKDGRTPSPSTGWVCVPSGAGTIGETD